MYAGRPGLDRVKAAFAGMTNPRGVRGSADDALAGADVFIGLSQPGAVTVEGDSLDGRRRDRLRDGQPDPGGAPEEIEGSAAVIGTGRSDYPNQINNVLAFPGVFRGALDVRATAITEGMKLAAAEAIAAVVKPDELEADYVIPSVFNRNVAPTVADAVARAAEASGIARRVARSANSLMPTGADGANLVP